MTILPKLTWNMYQNRLDYWTIKQTFKNEKDINYAKNVLRPTGN